MFNTTNDKPKVPFVNTLNKDNSVLSETNITNDISNPMPQNKNANQMDNENQKENMPKNPPKQKLSTIPSKPESVFTNSGINTVKSKEDNNTRNNSFINEISNNSNTPV